MTADTSERSHIAADDSARPPGRLRMLAIMAGAAVLLPAGIWSTAGLSLTNLDGAPPRILLPFVFVVAMVAVLIFLRPLRRAWLASLAMTGCVAVWYFSHQPSNDRIWAPEFARLATATVNGDQVTIHNYHVLERGADGRMHDTYVDRTFDVNDIVRADLIMSYWGPKRIAHALVSFEFSDDEYVAMSIEVRRRASQKRFSMISSLFRNFELIYLVGNERALIGEGLLDDYHRLYLYRTSITPQRAKALFLRYVAKLNSLATRPEWYNALTDNCTTGIYMHLREVPPPPPFSLAILLNGYLPERIYEHGVLDREIPFDELQRLCDIKRIGREFYDSPDFSRLIRQHIPVPGTSSEQP